MKKIKNRLGNVDHFVEVRESSGNIQNSPILWLMHIKIALRYDEFSKRPWTVFCNLGILNFRSTSWDLGKSLLFSGDLGILLEINLGILETLR